MSFTGGKLKLKGGDLPGIKKKKKKDTKALTLADGEGTSVEASEAAVKKAEDLKKILHGHALESPGEDVDRRTAAEKKYEQRMKKLEEERLRKMATKSHRERINDFNTQLANLSEHHDIPKVGPG